MNQATESDHRSINRVLETSANLGNRFLGFPAVIFPYLEMLKFELQLLSLQCLFFCPALLKIKSMTSANHSLETAVLFTLQKFPTLLLTASSQELSLMTKRKQLQSSNFMSLVFEAKVRRLLIQK